MHHVIKSAPTKNHVKCAQIYPEYKKDKMSNLLFGQCDYDHLSFLYKTNLIIYLKITSLKRLENLNILHKFLQSEISFSHRSMCFGLHVWLITWFLVMLQIFVFLVLCVQYSFVLIESCRLVGKGCVYPVLFTATRLLGSSTICVTLQGHNVLYILEFSNELFAFFCICKCN